MMLEAHRYRASSTIQDIQVDNVLIATQSKLGLRHTVLIFFLLLVAGVLLYGVATPPSASPHYKPISQQALEDDYGIRVNLVAVTAAGGFVDVRIKIVDGEKAKLLLGDAKNFPALLTGKDIVLDAPADTKSQDIRYENGGTMFIMYPNSGNAIKHGEPVSILFGDVALDAINAQ